MARNMQPIAKRCKALGISPAVMGYAKKETNRNPGGQMRKKKSEYGIQLNEKQKVKFVYGILEKQFRAYYEKATTMPGPKPQRTQNRMTGSMARSTEPPQGILYRGRKLRISARAMHRAPSLSIRTLRWELFIEDTS